MIETDKEEFGILLGLAAEAYGVELSETRISIYWEGLKDLTIDLIREALNELIRCSKWFPKIAEIRSYAGGGLTIEDKGLLAFQSVTDAMKKYGSWETIQFEDVVTAEVVEILGGWEFLCSLSKNDWDYRQKDFIQIYRVNYRRDLKRRLSIGTFDRINQDNPDQRMVGNNKTIFIKSLFSQRLQIEHHEKEKS